MVVPLGMDRNNPGKKKKKNKAPKLAHQIRPGPGPHARPGHGHGHVRARAAVIECEQVREARAGSRGVAQVHVRERVGSN